MHNSNAAARKRRAPQPPPLAPQQSQTIRGGGGGGGGSSSAAFNNHGFLHNHPGSNRNIQPGGQQQHQQQPAGQIGLTLQQVITLIDRRLISLETFMSEIQQEAREMSEQFEHQMQQHDPNVVDIYGGNEEHDPRDNESESRELPPLPILSRRTQQVQQQAPVPVVVQQPVQQPVQQVVVPVPVQQVVVPVPVQQVVVPVPVPVQQVVVPVVDPVQQVPVRDNQDYKFGLLLDEMTSLKTALLNLQSYTMDVNRKLFVERNILSNFVPAPVVTRQSHVYIALETEEDEEDVVVEVDEEEDNDQNEEDFGSINDPVVVIDEQQFMESIAIDEIDMEISFEPAAAAAVTVAVTAPVAAPVAIIDDAGVPATPRHSSSSSKSGGRSRRK